MTNYGIRSIVLALALAPFAAHASVIDFEGVVDPTGYYPDGATAEVWDGYAGYDWDNFYVMDGIIAGQAADAGASGFQHGFTSGSFLGYNGYGDPAALSVRAGSPLITRVGGNFTASEVDGATLIVTGYLGGVQVQTGQISLMTSGPQAFSLTFAGGGVDTVVFSSPQDIFTADDVVVAVPEPAPMVALGLGALGLLRRRRSPKA